MKKLILRFLALVVLLVAAFVAYQYLTQPKLGDVPPIPPKSSSLTTTTDVQVAQDAHSKPVQIVDVAASGHDVLVIAVAGAETGTIEIELLNDVAPHHVARIEALARAGAYDNVIFHRVIDGFMAQTGDVKFGKRSSASRARVGSGSSEKPDLKAEFSNLEFKRGVVGMARSQSPDSANSQFFIMFDAAPFLNGKYTIVGRVISGQGIVDGLKKGDPNLNGSVTDPDYMRKVTVRPAG